MRPSVCSQCNGVFSVKFGEDSVSVPVKWPLLLHCGHSFCEKCLKKCLSNGKELKCPTCQKTMCIDGEICQCLTPDNFIVGTLWTKQFDLERQADKIFNTDAAKLKKSVYRQFAPAGVSCTDCWVAMPTCRCSKCNLVTCRDCFDKKHETMGPAKKSHKPIPYLPDGGGATKQPIDLPTYCPSHDHCHLEYYCSDDNSVICSRCIIFGGHKGHNVVTLEDKNKQTLSVLEPAIQTAQETIWHLEKSIKLLDTHPQTHASADVRKVENDVHLHFQHIHSLLQAREQQLVNRLHKAVNQSPQYCEDLKARLIKDRLNLDVAVFEVSKVMHRPFPGLLDASDLMDRLTLAKDLPCVLSSISDRDDDSSAMFCADDSLTTTILEYGRITENGYGQQFSLNPAGEDCVKPPADELQTYSVSVLDSSSVTGTSDSESVTDSNVADVEMPEMPAARSSPAPQGDHQPPISTSIPSLLGNGPMLTGPSLRLCLLPLGAKERVRVTHIKSPALFFVQLRSQHKELVEQQNCINRICHSSRSRTLTGVEIGSCVFAKFTMDKIWYRAQVIGMKEQPTLNVSDAVPNSGDHVPGNQYLVFFYDYGNTETVPLDHMLPLMENFSTLHVPFAFRCYLSDLHPVNKSGWSSKATNVMLNICDRDLLDLTVVKVGSDGVEVDLVKSYNNKHLSGSSSTISPVSVRDSLVFLEVARFGTSASVAKNSPQLHGKRGYITMPCLPLRSVVEVGVTCVISPYQFYAQLYSDEMSDNRCQMTAKIQSVYTKEICQQYTVFCPTIGMVCVAKFHKNHCWYRAVVVGLCGSKQVQVQFVDFGNTEVVDFTDVCHILHDFIKFPMQAILCGLEDVNPINGKSWTQEAVQWFKSAVEMTLCRFKVTGDLKTPNTLKGILYGNLNRNIVCFNVELVHRAYATTSGELFLPENIQQVLQMVVSLDRPLNASVSMAPQPCYQPQLQQDSRFPTSGRGKSQKPKMSVVKASQKSVGKKSKKLVPLMDEAHRGAVTEAVGNTVGDDGDGDGAKASLSTAVRDRGQASCKPTTVFSKILICHLQSPAHFYIQMEEKHSALEKLMVDLMAYQELPSADSGVWKEGDFCVAQYTVDLLWYRAKIMGCLSDSARFEVYMLDYGYTDTLNDLQLRPLNPTHAAVQCFAERCHLVNLMPAGSTDRNKWSITAREFILKEISDHNLFVKLEGNRSNELGLPVDVLIEVIHPETALQPSRFEYLSLAHMIEERGLGFPTNRLAVEEQDAFSASALPLRTPQYSLGGGGVGGRKEKSVDCIVLVQSGLDVDCHSLLPTQTSLSVCPVCVDDVGIIYAHGCDQDEVSRFEAFVRELNTFCSTPPTQNLLEVTVGQVCLAFFEDDGCYCRARVLSVTGDKITVKFLDYGNICTVGYIDLRVITPELASPPQWVYEFTLHNLSPGTDDGLWSDSFLELIYKLVINKQCVAHVKSTPVGEPVEVELSLPGGFGLSQVLLDAGMVGKKDNMDDLYRRTVDVADALKCARSFSLIDLGTTGCSSHVLVTHIDLPNVVYLQCPVSPSHQPNGVPGSGDVNADFSQMMDDLNDLSSHCPMFTKAPISGEMCRARFSVDDRWYRGLIVTSFPADEMAIVLYIDYGNSEAIPLTRLGFLPNRFMETPALAIRAYLHIGLPPAVDRWSKTAYQAMVQAILHKQHVACVKHELPLTVELRDEEFATLSYQSLIDDGIAILPDTRLPDDHSEHDGITVDSDHPVQDVVSPLSCAELTESCPPHLKPAEGRDCDSQ